MGTFSRGCYKQELQRATKTSGLSKHVRSDWQPREKGASVSVEVVKASEKEFLFVARKPLFLGMHRFRFLSEASWETVTFVFNYFFMLLSFLKFLIQALHFKFI